MRIRPTHELSLNRSKYVVKNGPDPFTTPLSRSHSVLTLKKLKNLTYVKPKGCKYFDCPGKLDYGENGERGKLVVAKHPQGKKEEKWIDEVLTVLRA